MQTLWSTVSVFTISNLLLLTTPGGEYLMEIQSRPSYIYGDTSLKIYDGTDFFISIVIT